MENEKQAAAKDEGMELMELNDEAPLDDKPTPSGEPSKPEVEISEKSGSLAAAIELLESGKPLVLSDGFLITDSGHTVMAQYVDIGVDKLNHRPAILVKSIEAKYGLEYALNIQVSAPSRFREYGETFIRDDQEGSARHDKKTEISRRSFEDHNREQERALSLLGLQGVNITNTKATDSQTDSESMTFGGSSWIYCTSILSTCDEQNARRAKLPGIYDHESVIRQPIKFAFAFGAMFADQRGPQGRRGHYTHVGGIRSSHESQTVLHGPVWYTDDVLGFLKSRQSEPLYNLYPLFVKHSKYRDQREYRFVIHCEAPVVAETLRLNISGAMRDALAPPGEAGHVDVQYLDDSGTDSSSQKVISPAPTHHTNRRTRQNFSRQRRTFKFGDKVSYEEIITTEETITLTSKVPSDNPEQVKSGPEAPKTEIGEIIETENLEVRTKGVATDKMTKWHRRVITAEDTSDLGKLFSLEDRDRAADFFEAVGKPFGAFSSLSQQAAEALKKLAHIASHIEPEAKVQAMSACWNGIWAICNLYECFGDIIASVDIVQKEFVAIKLKESAHSDAEGEILVGPLGTFAYLLTRGDEQLPGIGGTKHRLLFFPDLQARAAFQKFGWIPQEEQ